MNEQTYYVIAASPLSQSGHGGNALFYGPNCEIVNNKLEAKIFMTFGDAKEFAVYNKIDLENAVPYIDSVIYSQNEMNDYWRIHNKN